MTKRERKPIKIDPFLKIGDEVFVADGVELRCGKVFAIHDRSLNDYVYAVQFDDSKYLADVRFYEYGSLYKSIMECMRIIGSRIESQAKMWARQKADALIDKANEYNYLSRQLEEYEEDMERLNKIYEKQAKAKKEASK